MALDIKPTRSELINLKRRIKQTKNVYKLLKMKRYVLFHEFRTLLSDMIQAKKELTESYVLAKSRIDLANAIEGGLKVKSAAIANSSSPEVEVERRNTSLFSSNGEVIEVTRKRDRPGVGEVNQQHLMTRCMAWS